MIKTLTLALIGSACLLPISAQRSQTAQERLVAQLRFSGVNVKADADSLRVHFDCLLPARQLKRAAALRLVPRYVTANGDFLLPAVLINGSIRAGFYAREQAALSHEAYVVQMGTRVIKQNAHQPVQFSYAAALKIPRAATGQVVVDAYVEDCCKSRLIAPIALLAGTPQSVPLFFERNVTFVRPNVEKVKTRKANLSVRINFEPGKHDLLPYYQNNAYELSRVDSVLRPMQQKPDLYRITQIRVHGYASPEAPAAANARLSQRRADMFRDYLVRHYALQGLSEFPSLGMGEDWAGLRQALEARPLTPSRQERVLSVINRTEDYDERERLLRQLDYGHVFRTLLDDYFPALRRMDMTIAYNVRPLALDEAEVMIDGRPQDLSAAELFDVARWRNNDQVLTTHRPYYGREFTMATAHFGHDPIVWLNASSAALLRGDQEEAKRMLEQVGPSPLVYNNWGLYFWAVGDATRAENYFRQALTVEATKATAEYNLSQLTTWLQQRTSVPQPSSVK